MHWKRIWALALVTAVVLGAATELFWRSRGSEPSIVDDIPTWCWQRAACSDADRNRLAVAGQSRIAAGLDFTTLTQVSPETKPVMLAVFGRSPMAAIENLCLDPNFRGLVLCSVTAQDFLPLPALQQLPYVDAYQQSFPWTHFDAALEAWIQSKLTIAGANGSLAGTLKSIARDRRFPSPNYVTIHADRTCEYDYSKVDSSSLFARMVGKRRIEIRQLAPYSPEAWAVELPVVADWIRQLRQRGGDIVFVRMPTAGGFWDIDEEAFPRRQYWDRIGPLTGALTIHFRDIPEIRDIACPDSSHIDRSSRALLTRALCKQLSTLGLLPRPPVPR